MDISNHRVKLRCPNCSFETDVQLKQFIAEEIIICPGCLKEIKLIDENGSTSRAQKKLKNLK